MATHTKEPENLYKSKNHPEVNERRLKKDAELKSGTERILAFNPKRKPDWDRKRIMEMDKHALKHQKRCIMWDDAGAGFYLLVNWDWSTNRPKKLVPEKSHEPGWYHNQKQMLRAPLIDPTVPDDRLADWIDKNTMAVHQFLDKLDKIVKLPTGELQLDDPYFAELQSL